MYVYHSFSKGTCTRVNKIRSNLHVMEDEAGLVPSLQDESMAFQMDYSHPWLQMRGNHQEVEGVKEEVEGEAGAG